jgi:Protein of unknown function (DUF3558)
MNATRHRTPVGMTILVLAGFAAASSLLAGCTKTAKTNDQGPGPGGSVTSTATTPSGGGPALTGMDFCALLSATEVATVTTGTAEATPQPAHEAQGITTGGCTWDTATDKLQVTVLSGIPVGQLRLSFDTERNDNNGRVVDGLGDFAVVFSDTPIGADVKVIHATLAVIVDLVGPGASGKQDAMVTLARSVVSHL